VFHLFETPCLCTTCCKYENGAELKWEFCDLYVKRVEDVTRIHIKNAIRLPYTCIARDVCTNVPAFSDNTDFRR
jgi:hypothetical protein